MSSIKVSVTSQAHHINPYTVIIVWVLYHTHYKPHTSNMLKPQDCQSSYGKATKNGKSVSISQLGQGSLMCSPAQCMKNSKNMIENP